MMTTIRTLRNLSCWALGSALLAMPLAAQGAAHLHQDGTIHRFVAVSVPGGITWADASREAAKAGGYLATITSISENAAIYDVIRVRSELWKTDPNTNKVYGPWIGGVQNPGGTEPAGGWGWSELEPYNYDLWTVGEPDNNRAFGTGSADRILFGGINQMTFTWADAASSDLAPGYVIEYAHQNAINTVGLLTEEANANKGYTLFSPLGSTTTFLIDHRGRLVHTWQSSFGTGQSVYLLENGNLLRCGATNNPASPGAGDGGLVEMFDWDNNLLWRYVVSSSTEIQHHDIAMMPNGNVLMIIWHKKTQAEAIAAGRNPNKIIEGAVWPEKIIEVRPTGLTTGDIVWQWDAWDHLVQDHDATKANFGDPAAHPELMDLNYTLQPGGVGDWMHANAIDYNPQLDQIALSFRSFDEIWVIDHSTTTAEAAGHTGGRSGKGGDILYRWGNPRTYRAGTVADQTLFKQHDIQWIKPGLPGAGNFLVFNNGTDRVGGNFSTADEFVAIPDANGNYPRPTNGPWGPAAPVWTYTPIDGTRFYSAFVSGVQRLRNGNTMVCGGFLGRIREIAVNSNTPVWEFVNPMARAGLSHQGAVTLPGERAMFRSPFYEADYPAFQGRSLVPGEAMARHDSVLLVEGSTVMARVPHGETATLSLRAANQQLRPYFVACSATKDLLPVDTRWMRMGWDGLTDASLAGSAPTIFDNFAGTLDTLGRATARIHIPNDPALQGLRVYSTFFVVNGASPNTVSFISNTVEIEVW